MKNNKNGFENTLNDSENACDGKNCNSVSPNQQMGINEIANLEAGTDVLVEDNVLMQEMAINSGLGAVGGVSEAATYYDLADYSMIPTDDDESIQNYQGS